jgi:hypothetical protein
MAKPIDELLPMHALGGHETKRALAAAAAMTAAAAPGCLSSFATPGTGGSVTGSR